MFGDLVRVRRGALAEHHGALQIHDHHAAQHAGGGDRIGEIDQPARALAAKPLFHRAAHFDDRRLIKGGREFGKAIAFADDETIDGDRLFAQRQRAEGDQNALQRLAEAELGHDLVVRLQQKLADAIGNNGGEEVGLRRDEPVERLGRNPRPLRDVAHIGAGIAVRLKLLRCRLNEQLARFLVGADLRAPAWPARHNLI